MTVHALTDRISMPPAGIHVIDDPAQLSTVLQPDCGAAIWNRKMPQDVLSWLGQLNPAQLPQGRIVLRPDAVPDAVATLLNMADTPDTAERDWLQSDIAQLAERFANLMRAPFLRLRLSVVITNSCRKFHMDAVPARLVCTYRGTGTQYGVMTQPGADPLRVFTTPTGVPLVLRGSEWPDRAPVTILHRSPPIAGTGETRLLLVLDPVFDPEDAT